MPIESLICSKELQPFFNELPMPKGINGKEQNLNNFSFKQSFSEMASTMEVFRRMQYCHDSINEGRFFLCLAQRGNFPEIYRGPISAWGIDWVKSQYVMSSLSSYNASFDLFLQIVWFFYELYKTNKPFVAEIKNDNIDKILKGCKVEIIKNEANKVAIENVVYNSINDFCNTTCYKEIHNLCNAIKHRQRIEFVELCKGKHDFFIETDKYNFHSTLLKRSLSDVIGTLKDFHKEISKLCEICIPLISYNKK